MKFHMKEIIFKIINPEIVDCSSYHSTVYPEPESGINITGKYCLGIIPFEMSVNDLNSECPTCG